MHLRQNAAARSPYGSKRTQLALGGALHSYAAQEHCGEADRPGSTSVTMALLDEETVEAEVKGELRRTRFLNPEASA